MTAGACAFVVDLQELPDFGESEPEALRSFDEPQALGEVFFELSVAGGRTQRLGKKPSFLVADGVGRYTG